MNTITVANGYELKSSGIGSGYLNILDGNGNTRKVEIKDVLYVPNIESNLLSVKRLAEKGFKIIFQGNICEIYFKKNLFAVAMLHNGLYKLNTPNTTQNQKILMASHSKFIHEWHRCLGHRDIECAKRMLKEVYGDYPKVCTCSDVCQTCIKGKLSRNVFPKNSKQKCDQILDLVHSDVCGPMEAVTPWG